jgi:hypothetical protein
MFYSFIADWFNLENPSAEITEDEYRLLSIWDGMTELLPERIDGMIFLHILCANIVIQSFT